MAECKTQIMLWISKNKNQGKKGFIAVYGEEEEDDEYDPPRPSSSSESDRIAIAGTAMTCRPSV